MNARSGCQHATIGLTAAALTVALAGCSALQPPVAPPPAAVEMEVRPAAPTAPMIWAIPKSRPAGFAAAADPGPRVVVARLPRASLLWPVRGQVRRGFGEQPNGVRNDGVDISAAEGSPVVAVDDGVVTYAGNDLPGYGNMLLVRHADGYTSVYAHNQLLLAAEGVAVRRGQQIATVGHTGTIGDACLHFQLRAGERPVDPEPFLQPLPTMVASLAADEPPSGAR